MLLCMCRGGGVGVLMCLHCAPLGRAGGLAMCGTMSIVPEPSKSYCAKRAFQPYSSTAALLAAANLSLISDRGCNTTTTTPPCQSSLPAAHRPARLTASRRNAAASKAATSSRATVSPCYLPECRPPKEPHAQGDPGGRCGLSSNKMALITSDYGIMCSLRIKWP